MDLWELEQQMHSVSSRVDGEVYSLMQMMLKIMKSQQARIQELERQVSQSSKNSHKPPSSDGLKKPSIKEEGKGKRKAGGQAGHKGSTLKMVSHVDEVIVHRPESCSVCGQDLRAMEPESVQRAQVFDLPEIALKVSEHQVETKRCCCCGWSTSGILPEGIVVGAQYGSGVRAFVSYLHTYQLIPAGRISELFEDLFGHGISAGTCINVQRYGYEALEDFEAGLKRAIGQSKWLGADETGVRIAGKTSWLHTLSTSSHTLFQMHPNRGRKAMDACGVLPSYEGRLVHDRYASYTCYPARHALCNAHLLRDLESVIEQTRESWAKKLQRLLLQLKKVVAAQKARGSPQLTDHRLQTFRKRYDKYVDIGLAHHPIPEQVPGKKGRKKKGFTRNLLEDLRDQAEAVLRFAYDFYVPFDNNQAERDLRMSKIKIKVSGCFRSWMGAHAFARIRSYVNTAKKQGIRPFLALKDVFEDKALVPQLSIVLAE